MEIKYKLLKERRKSIKIFINEGKVIIKTPLFVSNELIDNIIYKNREWIKKALEKYEENKKGFMEGERFLFFGEEYILRFDNNITNDFMIRDKFFYIKYKNSAKEALKRLYIDEAKRYIPNRVDKLSKKFGIEYGKIRINSAKTRWGSCSSKKNLNFSYRLIMCPKDVIDYVIIHELSHITHMNHSKKFWTLVSKRCPNYKAHEKWLKDNSIKTLFL